MRPDYRATNRRDSDAGGHTIGRTSVTALALTALVVGTATAISKASAQATESVIVDIGECVGIESRDRRFECYERVAEDAKRSSAALPSEPPVRDEQSSQSGQSPVEEGSQATNRAGEDSPSTASSEPEQPDEIRSVITALRETVPSTYLISLENGQVWRQTQARRYRMTPGMTVRIYSARGSSYRLSAMDLNGFIQVERIR